MQLHFPDFLLYGKFGVGLINGVRFDKSHNLKKFEKNVSSKLDVDFSCPFTFKVAMGMDYHINKNLSLNFEGGLLFAFVNSSWRINGQELFNDLPDETGYAHNVQLTVGLQFWAL